MKHLPRRTFLRGIGASISLPILDAMLPAFALAAPTPIRMLNVYAPTGMMPDDWYPQFDPNQSYQLDAIAGTVDLFEGQPQGAPEYSVIQIGDWGGMFAGQVQTELGVGNQMLLSDNKLATNVRAMQARNDIEIADPVMSENSIALKTRGLWSRVRGTLCER